MHYNISLNEAIRIYLC